MDDSLIEEIYKLSRKHGVAILAVQSVTAVMPALGGRIVAGNVADGFLLTGWDLSSCPSIGRFDDSSNILDQLTEILPRSH